MFQKKLKTKIHFKNFFDVVVLGAICHEDVVIFRTNINIFVYPIL